ncbi:MAG: hypothetical protein ACI3W7_07555 [Oscillospiraceae bacterium]
MADSHEITEAVCIHTRKIYDSCRDKDCMEDLRVYPTACSQQYIESAFSVRPSSATLLYADVQVDEISFNRGYYTIDVTYFYEVCGVTFPCERPVRGLCVFNKRVMLFGSESSAKVFSSDGSIFDRAVQPIAVAECVDPIVLNMKLVDACTVGFSGEPRDIPKKILAHFGEDLVLSDGVRMLTCTLGQFSIIRLERDSQLVVPVYDYCLPEKDCTSNEPDDPCSLFQRISFPLDEFFPPDSIDAASDYRSAKQDLES